MAKPDVTVHADAAPRPGTQAGLRIREDVAFTNANGREDRSTQKRVQNILEKAGLAVQRLLAVDETVLYAARAQAPVGLFEQLTMGWYIYRVSASVLVFTNRRILHLLVDSGGRWRGHWKTVAYGDLAEVTTKGWLSPVLWLKYRNGKKDEYWRLKRADAKKIQALAAALLPASSAESTAAQSMVSLCPECMAALEEKVYHCASCGLVFKDEKTMIKRSLLIPGGGYFYCGYTFLGVMDFLAEAWLTIILLILVAGAVTTWGQPPSNNPDAGDPVGFLITAILVAGVLALEKYYTIHHCRRFVREFISTGQKDPMRMQSAGMSAGALR